jgi:peptidoglycan/LPS O-acetylase OafA/YrhL
LADRNAPGPTGIAYCPPIDGLRALAALCVLYAHLVSPTPGFASAGVRLFFCISGYLITHILLSARASGRGTAQLLRAFYIRRALRIWPAYYVALCVALLFDPPMLRETAGWHLLFGTNILLSTSGTWEPGIASHLWTLAVEEQFYLLWPLVLLLAPRRAIGWIIAALPLLCGLFIAGLSEDQQMQEPGPLILLPGQLDVLGGGALLAFAERQGWPARPWLVPLVVIALFIAPLTIGLDWGGSMLIGNLITRAGLAVAYPLSATMFVAIILFARHGPRWLAGPMLGNRVLVWLGQRSYGIYLYHLYLLSAATALGHGGAGWPTFIIVGGASIALAAVSWRFLEQPLLRWKSHVPYVPPRGVARGLHAV